MIGSFSTVYTFSIIYSVSVNPVLLDYLSFLFGKGYLFTWLEGFCPLAFYWLIDLLFSSVSSVGLFSGLFFIYSREL